MTSHVHLIPIACGFLLIRISINHNFIIYLFIHSFILYFIPERILNGRIYLWIIFIRYPLLHAFIQLLCLLNCIYEASALLVSCFRNEENVFKQMSSPEPLNNFKVLKYFIEPFIAAIIYLNSN